MGGAENNHVLVIYTYTGKVSFCFMCCCVQIMTKHWLWGENLLLIIPTLLFFPGTPGATRRWGVPSITSQLTRKTMISQRWDDNVIQE